MPQSNNKIVKKTINWGGREFSLEVGRVARAADAAVLARYGDTVVLATVCYGGVSNLGYFPLSVEFEEKLYAGGRISSSRFIKREARPPEHAILSGRLIDRSIRPLFPKDYKNDVQVILTVLSVDQDNDMDIVGAVGASAALAISSIPWKGPIATARIGLKEGTFMLNPINGDAQDSALDLVLSAKRDGIMMVEASAREVPEKTMLDAFAFAQKEVRPVLDMIDALAKEVGKEKHTYAVDKPEKAVEQRVRDYIRKEILPILEQQPALSTDDTWGGQAMEKIAEHFGPELDEKYIEDIFGSEFKTFVRESVFTKGRRLDHRKNDEVRPLTIDVGILPRTHGTALFQRGETQALSIATLGSPSLEQLMEGPLGEETKRYMHHYNFPPFCSGETGRLGPPKRREIGHGILAERALLPVIPNKEAFPYTIRVVSEIMSSSGSTSMASVCGSTLALMDAGVPIAAPVSGIAMGLLTKDGKHVILTDIGYAEDANGDMDCKVAGTKKGITAIQMDIKIDGVSHAILTEALEQAREGRLHILSAMLKVLPASRKTVSPHAPKIESLSIPPSKIGELIGPGGKMIRKIQEETGTDVDVDDEGIVSITGMDADGLARAKQWIKGLTHEPVPGEEFEGKVTRVLDFGAFVEILPGKEGMIHISKLADRHVDRVEDVVNVGDTVKVRVEEIDDQGRVNLVMADLPEGYGREERPARRSFRDSRPPRRQYNDRGGFRGERFPRRNFSGGRSGDSFRGRSDRRGGPPGRRTSDGSRFTERRPSFRDRSRGPRR